MQKHELFSETETSTQEITASSQPASVTMHSKYIANDFTPLLSLEDPELLLKETLEKIVTELPPRDAYPVLKGLWAGPTGFAYLFLHISTQHPDLVICGQTALTWAKRYIAGERSHRPLDSRCGIGCERLAFLSVRAAINQDLDDVKDFLTTIPTIVAGSKYPDEVLQGRSGTLYLLRMISHWVPDGAPLVEESIKTVIKAILADGQDWKWHGRRYLGAVHGDIGIVTQLVLTSPSLAPQLEDKLAQVLDMQLPSGNWTSSDNSNERSLLVQFCHGAPGFILSLVAIRRHFPALQQKIDEVVEKARQCVWREGLLVKEPSICHGIFGNAL